MAQKLIVRPLAVLSEALSSVPGCVTIVYNSRHRGSNAVFSSLQVHTGGKYTHVGKTHTHRIKVSNF